MMKFIKKEIEALESVFSGSFGSLHYPGFVINLYDKFIFGIWEFLPRRQIWSKLDNDARVGGK